MNSFHGMSIIAIVFSLLMTITSLALANSANGQMLCDNEEITGSNQRLPVILVHGYRENSSIWSEWERFLEVDGIPFCTISFHSSDDMCGSAADHARELEQIVQQVKSITGQTYVNIVGHSKGGLDARVYLANTGTTDVANLIMIGTANAGSVLADFPFSDGCTPAILDLRTDAPDTNVPENTNTHYFTIAGECLSYYGNIIPGPDDGLVSVSSVESLPYSTTLGQTQNCHWDLLGQEEYRLAQPILLAE
jgi:pimeloyl-ACP methyl ester carboxylesterase